MTQAPKCSSAGRPGARAAQVLERPRWRAHRLALDDPNDPTADGRRAARAPARARALAGWRLRACGLAGWRAGGRAPRAMGGEGPGDRPKMLWRLRKKFFIFYKKPLALSPPAYGMLTV